MTTFCWKHNDVCQLFNFFNLATNKNPNYYLKKSKKSWNFVIFLLKNIIRMSNKFEKKIVDIIF